LNFLRFEETSENISRVQKLFENAPKYFLNVSGEIAGRGDGEGAFRDLPPKEQLEELLNTSMRTMNTCGIFGRPFMAKMKKPNLKQALRNVDRLPAKFFGKIDVDLFTLPCLKKSIARKNYGKD